MLNKTHQCPEWDFATIEPDTPEMSVCICDEETEVAHAPGLGDGCGLMPDGGWECYCGHCGEPT